MELFKVIRIIDGDTIEVSPNWAWNGKVGSIVKVLGYTTPVETNMPFATTKIRNLLSNQLVELKGTQVFNSSSDAIACRVFLNGVDISKYFPEFQISKDLSFNTPLFDIPADIEKLKTQYRGGMNFFEHWTIKLTLLESSFSAPSIFTEMENFYNNTLGKQLFYVFNRVYREKSNSQTIVFRQGLSSVGGASNHFGETILQITDNTIRFEYAQFNSEKILLTNLFIEVGTLLSLLFFCKYLYSNNSYKVAVDIDLSSNGDLIFQNHPNSLNVFCVPRAVYTYYLNPNKKVISKVISNIENNILILLMQDIIHGFVCPEPSILSSNPFLSIIEAEQSIFLDNFKKNFEKKR